MDEEVMISMNLEDDNCEDNLPTNRGLNPLNVEAGKDWKYVLFLFSLHMLIW